MEKNKNFIQKNMRNKAKHQIHTKGIALKKTLKKGAAAKVYMKRGLFFINIQ